MKWNRFIQIDFRCSSCFHFGELFHFDLLFSFIYSARPAISVSIFSKNSSVLVVCVCAFFSPFLHLAIFIVLFDIFFLLFPFLFYVCVCVAGWLFSFILIVSEHSVILSTISNEHWQCRHTYGMQSMPIASKKNSRKKQNNIRRNVYSIKSEMAWKEKKIQFLCLFLAKNLALIIRLCIDFVLLSLKIFQMKPSVSWATKIDIIWFH